MTINKYLYNLDAIPPAHARTFEHLNACIVEAFNRYETGNRTPVRVMAGSYMYVTDMTGTVEPINLWQYTDDAPEGLSRWWMCNEARNVWYGDPRPTYREIKESVGAA